MPVNVFIDVKPGPVPASTETPITVSYGNLRCAPNDANITFVAQDGKGSVKLRFGPGSAKQGRIQWSLPAGWIFVPGTIVFQPRQAGQGVWSNVNPQGNALTVNFDFSAQAAGTTASWDHQYKVKQASTGQAYDVDPEIENDN